MSNRKVSFIGHLAGFGIAGVIAFAWHIGIQTPFIFFAGWMIFTMAFRQAAELDY